jgi:hypothetical protein
VVAACLVAGGQGAVEHLLGGAQSSLARLVLQQVDEGIHLVE